MVQLRQELIVCQSDLSWRAGALARQRHNLRGASVSFTRRTASRRAGGGSAPLYDQLLVHANINDQIVRTTATGDRMSAANKKTGRHLGNFPQALSHLALREAMPCMIVLERRAEL